MYDLFKNFFGKVLKTLKTSIGGQIYMEDPVVLAFLPTEKGNMTQVISKRAKPKFDIILLLLKLAYIEFIHFKKI